MPKGPDGQKRPSHLTAPERAVRAELKRLFWTDWDPIGCGVPEDEYDEYAIHAFNMLKNGATAGQLADYLSLIETDHMELSPADGAGARNLAVATKARALVRGHRAVK